jgi:hypothetical protein
MKATETLNKVRAMLGIQVKFEQAKLDNGTILESEAFAQGDEVFVVNEDERIPVPKGEYAMEDGKVLVVAEDGIVGEIKEAEAQEEAEEEVEQKEEVEMEQETKEPKKVVKSISEEVFFSTIETLTKKIEALELALQPKEEVEEVEEKVEMSAEPKETISHNPETETIKRGFRMSPQKRITTQDRVFRKLANK